MSSSTCHRTGEPLVGWNARIGIVLADAHALTRQCIRLLLEAEEDFEVVAEARDLVCARRLVERRMPRVLVLDLSMPDGSSFRAIERLHVLVPATSIVAMTMDHSRPFEWHALRSGAVGCIAKDKADRDLAEAVRCAAGGARCPALSRTVRRTR
jgi:DNA-binding NarL/FixJ family response regulator